MSGEFSIYWEDLAVGVPRTFGAYPVTREDVIDFASKYDPQPFHLDDEAAAKSPVFGRLAASGFHTLAMATRITLDDHGGKQANMGGTGISDLRWLSPVYPGDVLSVRETTLSKRRSRSKPEMGLMQQRVEVLNQDGVVVMSYEAGGLIRVRDPAAAMD